MSEYWKERHVPNASLSIYQGTSRNPQDDSNDVTMGDVDGSGKIDLLDLMMTLQVISGETLGSDVYKGGDINGDGKIGSEEAIYIYLRK